MSSSILKIGGVACIVLLLTWAGLILHSRNSSLTIRSDLVSSTSTSAAPYGSDSYVFSDWVNLEVYDYVNGQELSITPSGTGIGAIDTVSVSQDQNYVVFHDQLVNQSGSLAAQLGSQGLNSEADHWWVYDVQSKTFQTLPSDVLIAKVSGQNIYTLTSTSEGELIETFQLPNLKQTGSFSINGSNNFFVANSGFYLQSPDGGVTYTSDGVVNHQLLTSGTMVGVTSDGRTVVAVLGNGSFRTLVTVDTRTNTTTTIDKGIGNTPVWSTDTNAVLYSTNAGLYSYSLTTHKITRWNVIGNNLTPNLQLVTLLDGTTAIVSNSTNNYIIGSNIAVKGNPQ